MGFAEQHAADAAHDFADLPLDAANTLNANAEKLNQLLFTYLHLAPAPDLTRRLCASGAVANRGTYGTSRTTPWTDTSHSRSSGYVGRG